MSINNPPGALPWIAVSNAQIEAARDTKPSNTSPPAGQRLSALEYLKQEGVDSLDPRFGLRTENVTSMAARLTADHPHASTEVWDAYLRDTKFKQGWLWDEPPIKSPEAERKRIAKMTAAQRLEESNRYGGKKK